MERASRSQQNLLEFIEAFVQEHGYGPSYREIMRALDYKSVSTVAIHINGLIAKGRLRKQGRSARSLEVVKTENIKPMASLVAAEQVVIEKLQHFAGSEAATVAALEEMTRVFGRLELHKAEKAAVALQKHPRSKPL